MNFSDLRLKETTLKGLKANNFNETTEIQSKTIPPLLEGRNLIGQAKTGSGKTLAFGIPILETVDENQRLIQAVIITPTRELAKQVADEISNVAKFTNVKTMTIYGGVSIDNQINKIKNGVHVIVATPGRLIDHLKRGLQIKPKQIVLDEADKMFDMGFYDDVSYILHLLKGINQQFMFFGATIPDQIIALSKKYMKDPVIITIRKEGEERIPSTIEQYYYVVAESSNKLNLIYKTLQNLINEHNDKNGILKILIFAKTRIATRRLANDLMSMRLGFQTSYINSDLTQAAREKILSDFEKRGGILVATDVVSRGIDFEDITCVINYDMPNEIDTYVHRVGRTGRMEKDGLAFSFVSLDEHPLIFQIEKKFKTKIKKKILQRKGRRY
jgi:ATP-dependent RNA helicase DeaD